MLEPVRHNSRRRRHRVATEVNSDNRVGRRLLLPSQRLLADSSCAEARRVSRPTDRLGSSEPPLMAPPSLREAVPLASMFAQYRLLVREPSWSACRVERVGLGARNARRRLDSMLPNPDVIDQHGSWHHNRRTQHGGDCEVEDQVHGRCGNP